jgi:glycosyltransferase involved in cell wall biosynthesis
VTAAVDSVLASRVPLRLLLIANNPPPHARPILDGIAARDPRTELRVLDRNLGCAGGRRLGAELAGTEFVLFLDDDAELREGALELLVAELDAHPDALGVSALVVGPDERVQHCGGWTARSDDTVRFTHGGGGLGGDDPAVPETGASDWLPGTAALVRSAALREWPIDAETSAYYEDNEWSFRVGTAHAAPFRRCREAVAVHRNDGTPMIHSCELARVSWLAERLAAQARFFERHGVLLDVDLLHVVPEFAHFDGTVDVHAARLLLELIIDHDTDWLVTEWMGGGLEPLLERRQHIEAQWAELERRDAAAVDAAAAAAETEASLESEIAQLREQVVYFHQRHETLHRIEHGGWWRLRGHLMPVLKAVSAVRRGVGELRAR